MGEKGEGMGKRGEVLGGAGQVRLVAIANASAGLLGVQVVWGLQSANTSRILQGLGAGVAELPVLWIAAPITGLLVQPVVGWLSDRAQTRFGRRRPFLAAGAVLTAGAMALMATAQSLAWAVTALWLLTASVNIAMQPLRALLADLLPPGERARGYSIQVVLIGTGAVLASLLPWTLVRFGVAQAASASGIPPAVSLAFGIGAALLLGSVAWTLLSTPEPVVAPAPEPAGVRPLSAAVPGLALILAWTGLGIVACTTATSLALGGEVQLVGAVALCWAGALALLRARMKSARPVVGPLEIVADVFAMPPALRRLATTQFFCWFGLFAMWIYAVPAIAGRAARPGTTAYETLANWVGVLFGIYDAVAVAVAFALPALIRHLGIARSHASCLALGAMGTASLAFVPAGPGLAVPAALIGCAWASILSVPYALVAATAPADKRGTYLGIHNIFIVMPQVVGAASLGVILNRVLGESVSAMLLVAGASLGMAALTALRLKPE